MKKIYFKVYQDKEYVDGHPYFIETIEKVIELLPGWIKQTQENDELPPVFEPVEMEESEFKNLPEFTGF